MLTNRGASVAVLISSLLVALTGCGLNRSPEAPAEIIIAADLELSGTDAAVGSAYERALRLEIDQLNADQALTGGGQLRLMIRDNHADPSVSLSNITEFANNPQVAAIVTGPCGECAQAATETVNAKQVPTIALVPDAQVITADTARRYVFKIGSNASDDATALTDELVATGVRKLGLLTIDTRYGQEGQRAMLDEAQKANIEVTGRASVKPAENSLGQAAQAATSGQPDALVIWAYPAQASQIAVTIRETGYRGRLYFDGIAAGDLFLPSAASAATEGATMVFTQTLAIDDVITTTPAKAARKEFFRDYTAKYGTYYGYASFAADAARLIVYSVNKAGGVNHNLMRDVIETSQLDGLSGPLRITPVNHSALTPQALTTLVARGGRWRLAG